MAAKPRFLMLSIFVCFGFFAINWLSSGWDAGGTSSEAHQGASEVHAKESKPEAPVAHGAAKADVVAADSVTLKEEKPVVREEKAAAVAAVEGVSRTWVDFVRLALLADASTLGYHWEYNARALPSSLPRPLPLSNPSSQWHSNLKAGDTTHYGALVFGLLEIILRDGKYDQEDFRRFLRASWKANKKYYVDTATRKFVSGANPTSDEFSAVGRNAALLAIIDPVKNCDKFIAASKSQASVTHSKSVSLAAALFAEAFCKVLSSPDHPKPTDVLVELTKKEPYTVFSSAVQTGLDSAKKDSVAAIRQFGTHCPMPQALPGCLHLLAKFEGTPNATVDAVEASVLAGGDSSSRALPAVALLAAYAYRDNKDVLKNFAPPSSLILPKAVHEYVS